MTHSRSDIRALLNRHGLKPRRSLGQNFVADPDTVRRIARLSGAGPNRPVLEIGAGLGSLTLALAETGADVTAIEMDPDLVALLRRIVRCRGSAGPAPGSVRVLQADATACDFDEVLAGSDDWLLVANLPYNIAASLVIDLLRGVPRVASMLVMVQHEVAQRLAARPGDPAAGIGSVLVSYHAAAEIVGGVAPAVFHPEPKVDSALLRIERRPPPIARASLAADATVASAVGSGDHCAVGLADIEPLLRTAFGQRRKMLRRSLGRMLSGDDFAAAGVDPRRRPQTLALDEWAALADACRN